MTSQKWRLKRLFLNYSFVFNTRDEHFHNLKGTYFLLPILFRRELQLKYMVEFTWKILLILVYLWNFFPEQTPIVSIVPNMTSLSGSFSAVALFLWQSHSYCCCQVPFGGRSSCRKVLDIYMKPREFLENFHTRIKNILIVSLPILSSVNSNITFVIYKWRIDIEHF